MSWVSIGQTRSTYLLFIAISFLEWFSIISWLEWDRAIMSQSVDSNVNSWIIEWKLGDSELRALLELFTRSTICHWPIIPVRRWILEDSALEANHWIFHPRGSNQRNFAGDWADFWWYSAVLARQPHETHRQNQLFLRYKMAIFVGGDWREIQAICRVDVRWRHPREPAIDETGGLERDAGLRWWGSAGERDLDSAGDGWQRGLKIAGF